MGMGPVNRLVSRKVASAKGAAPAGSATANRVMSKVVASVRAKQVTKPVMPSRIMGGPVKARQIQRTVTGPVGTVTRSPGRVTIVPKRPGGG